MASLPVDASADRAAELARIASATSLPVVIQDAPGYLGSGLGPDVLVEVLRLAPNVDALKLEGGSEAVALVRARLGDAVPLWGGDGGRHLLDCLRSGAVGAIPGVEMIDRLVDAWRAERDGDGERADELFAALLPLLVSEVESLGRYAASPSRPRAPRLARADTNAPPRRAARSRLAATARPSPRTHSARDLAGKEHELTDTQKLDWYRRTIEIRGRLRIALARGNAHETTTAWTSGCGLVLWAVCKASYSSRIC